MARRSVVSGALGKEIQKVCRSGVRNSFSYQGLKMQGKADRSSAIYLIPEKRGEITEKRR